MSPMSVFVKTIKIIRAEKMNDIEVEYEIVKMLAEKRWKLQQEIAEVEAALEKNCKNFVIGADGLVEVGLGVC